jgi:hypothetical protein
MSMKDFHAKLVSADDKNPLFAALRKLSQLTDLGTSTFAEDPMGDWPIWNQDPPPPGVAYCQA